MFLFYPDIIFVEESVQHSTLTERICASAPNATLKIIADVKPFYESIEQQKQENNRALVLAEQRGPFLRHCPGTQKHLCCLYYNLDIAAGCDLGCTYCFLQGYLNIPYFTIYCNLEDLYTELDQKIIRHPQRFYRVGSGELSDSLTFDHLTALSSQLVPRFSSIPNAILELKTKSNCIDGLLDLQHGGRTVISWSLNSDAGQHKEEHQAATINERLFAAKECSKAGYKIGFHFDPMIYYPGWEDGYREVVDRLFQLVPSEQIVWISLGGLRYPASYDDIYRKNHPESDLYLGELLPGIDKKYRYFKPLRIEMFRKMHSWIRGYAEDVFVYLCMESKEVWEKSFEWSPKSSAELKSLLDHQVRDYSSSSRMSINNAG